VIPLHSTWDNKDGLQATIARLTDILLKRQQQDIYCRTDRLFAWLMIFQWVAGIIMALVISPRTWTGEFSQTHIHVWTAIFLGGAIMSLPVFLALSQAGRTSTRHVIAVSQMLMSALLIHLTGGRIETHFHVFGSLAFLAFYRDWRVLISASIVVAVDHFLRGIYWPQSVYGTVSINEWRWLEHSAWVVFEDIFLILAGRESLKEMKAVAERQAQLQITQDQIEATVQQRTAELMRSNKELEQFAYVTSHDLKEPLRNISGFAQLLADRYKGKLDKDADDFVQFITKGVSRMEGLINDLLAYSHVGKTSKNELVDSEKVLNDTLSDLRAIISESSAVVTHDPLPVIKGDSRELRQLFQNLLGNAIKFRKIDRPQIHVSVEQKDVLQGEKMWCFAVKDNGIGIDPKFGDRIFVIFQRLHNQAEYPGTGIGLAICKKIVERHGGDIWVDSELGKGSIFRFSIPCREGNPKSAKPPSELLSIHAA
jgi:signal transduction histidine kinase